MIKKPIKRFKTDEEFKKCAKEWQKKLFLTDWFIKFSLADGGVKTKQGDELTVDDDMILGLTKFSYVNKTAEIQIDNTKDYAEVSLVHELLHLKEEYIDTAYIEDGSASLDIESTNGVYIRNIFKRHQCMEQMAKSLIMTKYPSIDYDFFIVEDTGD